MTTTAIYPALSALTSTFRHVSNRAFLPAYGRSVDEFAEAASQLATLADEYADGMVDDDSIDLEN